MSNIGLVVAMSMEIPDIFRDKSSVHQIGDNAIHIVVSGIGQKRARYSTEKVCREFHPDYLMTLGFCGGTRDDLHIGHLVIADRVTYGRKEIELDNKYLDEATNALHGMEYHRGVFQTFDWPIFSRNRVSKDTLAVDMESFAIADIGRTYHIPTVMIKAVSDIVPEKVSMNSLLNLIKIIRGNAKAKNQLNEFAKQYFL